MAPQYKHNEFITTSWSWKRFYLIETDVGGSLFLALATV